MEHVKPPEEIPQGLYASLEFRPSLLSRLLCVSHGSLLRYADLLCAIGIRQRQPQVNAVMIFFSGCEEMVEQMGDDPTPSSLQD